MNRTLSGTTTPGQSGPGSNGNKGVLRIPQSCSITGTSLSDSLESYLGHSLWGSYHSAEMQSVYSTSLADWANMSVCVEVYKCKCVFFNTHFFQKYCFNLLKLCLDWLIDWFLNVNSSRVILCVEVRESRSTYVHIHLFCGVVSEYFFAHVPNEC